MVSLMSSFYLGCVRCCKENELNTNELNMNVMLNRAAHFQKTFLVCHKLRHVNESSRYCQT